MLQHEFEILPGMVFPQIEFSLDKSRISRGERTILRWNAERADEAVLWISAVSPVTPEPLDWVRIGQMGERVALAGEMEIAPEETTAYYLVVRTPAGLRGAREVVEVAEAEDREREPEIWQPQATFLERMVDRPHVIKMRPILRPALLGEPISQQAYWPQVQDWYAAPPAIWLSVPTSVVHTIFADETFTCSYTVANATYITEGLYCEGTFAVIDTSKPSGTKIDGGFYGAGGTPTSAAPASGQLVVGPTWTSLMGAPARATFWWKVSNPSGQSASADVRVHILTIPQIVASVASPKDDQRRSDIRKAVKDIEQKLHGGCIINNTALDQTVQAFKNGHVNRTEFWYRLAAEILCTGNITFLMKDVNDAQWGAGHWQEYTNEIVLEWSLKYAPYLPYVILHELVHKCGFNSELYKYGYSHAQIEEQAHAVSSACYP